MEEDLDRDMILDTEINRASLVQCDLPSRQLKRGLDFLLEKDKLSFGACELIRESLAESRCIEWEYTI